MVLARGARPGVARVGAVGRPHQPARCARIGRRAAVPCGVGLRDGGGMVTADAARMGAAGRERHRHRALAGQAPPHLRTPAHPPVSNRPGNGGGSRHDVCHAPQAAAAPLVEAPAGGSADGCARGSPRVRFAGVTGLACGVLSKGDGGDGRGGFARRLSQLPHGGDRARDGRAAGGAAPEEERRVYQAREGRRSPPARARAGCERAAHRDGRVRGAGAGAGRDDPRARIV